MNEAFLIHMEQGMTAEEQARLKRVYAPRQVAVPLSNAWGDLCVMDDGEIRCYGKEEGRRAFLASRDGFTWKLREVPDMRCMCSALRLPWAKKWVMTYAISGEGGFQGMEMPLPPEGAEGWQAAISAEGPGGSVVWRPIWNRQPVTCPRFPLALESRRRILVCANLCDAPGMRPIVARSDDDGETWQVSCLKAVPPHEAHWPHQSVRWQNGGVEGTILERSDGSLLLLARTAQDVHYQYESFDGGETWTSPVPSRFHGTLTMPTFLKRNNGDALLFWSNTQPLPETDKASVRPALDRGELDGVWEDVFTNRDANHCAISRDGGASWQGFREMALNPIRNASDFRSCGGSRDGLDKSIHQFQAVELPYGKVLLVYGQHPCSRGVLLFDPEWLMEKQRSEDFRGGLGNVSTQVYLKSVSGGFRHFSGHCAWNRTDGAVLMPDPDENFEEALYISASADPRLFSPLQGVTWNFPSAHSGCVTIRLRAEEEGVRLTLTDRWFNPSDPYAAALSPCSFDLGDMLSRGVWQDVSVEWDGETFRLLIGGRQVRAIAASQPASNGISYLLLQSKETCSGKPGTYVKSMEMNTR